MWRGLRSRLVRQRRVAAGCCMRCRRSLRDCSPCLRAVLVAGRGLVRIGCQRDLRGRACQLDHPAAIDPQHRGHHRDDAVRGKKESVIHSQCH